MTRTSSVTLTRLDVTGLLAQADAYVKQTQGEEYTARFGFDYAAVETPHGLYVLCSEGVGDEHPNRPLTLDIYAETPDTIAIIPVASATITPDRVRTLMTGEQVNLADFIRTFGGRLESNFCLWDRVLTVALSAPASV